MASAGIIPTTPDNVDAVMAYVNDAVGMHALLFDAILRRQPARAHSLMLEHIYQGRERILVFLENGPTPADEASDWHRISKTTPAPAAPVAASSPRTRRLRAVPSQPSRDGN
jgi:hypothetical protein